ncbi:MAG: DUF4124 domain-containing protein, partial [Thiohalocapsa sp.]
KAYDYATRLVALSRHRSYRLLGLACLGLVGLPLVQADQAALRAYQCTENGVKSFSDQPCGRGERRVFLGYSSPQTPSATNDADTNDRQVAAENAETNAFVERLQLKRTIARTEGRISDLQKERDAELDQLRSRMGGDAMLTQGQPGETRPDAQRLMAAQMADKNLVEEMRVVNTRYAQDIAVEEQRLEQMRGHLATMEGQ